jgi:hypothetical protein
MLSAPWQQYKFNATRLQQYQDGYSSPPRSPSGRRRTSDGPSACSSRTDLIAEAAGNRTPTTSAAVFLKGELAKDKLTSIAVGNCTEEFAENDGYFRKVVPADAAAGSPDISY